MDKPLKYFFIVTAIFAFFIGVFFLGLLTQKKAPVSNEYAVVDESDKSILDAKERSTETLDTLLKLYSAHNDSAFIRFSFEPTKGHIEHLWGKIIVLDSMHVKVRLNRKEGLEDIYYPGERELPVDRIEDWMVYLPNDNVRGGYTVQAMLRKDMEKPEANKDSLQRIVEKFNDR